MVDFSDFYEDNDRNNIIIQRSLREIDSQVLVNALYSANDDEKNMFFRNMSKRAVSFLLKDMDEEKNKYIPEAKKKDSQEMLKQKLRKHSKYFTSEIKPQQAPLPDIDLSSEDSVIRTFKALLTYVKTHGFLSIEGIESKIPNPVMRKGLELLIDGWEPLLIQSLLEKYKATYMKHVETELNMILEGIDSIAMLDLPLVMEEKLKAYCKTSVSE